MNSQKKLTGRSAQGIVTRCAKLILKEEKRDNRQMSLQELRGCVEALQDKYDLVSDDAVGHFSEAVVNAVNYRRSIQPLSVNVSGAAHLTFDTALGRATVTKKPAAGIKPISLKA